MIKALIARSEDKGPTYKSKTNEKITKLFTGVSAAALMLGAAGATVEAAGVTVTKTTKAVTIGTKAQVDFIDIDGELVTNNGLVGFNGVGIGVRNGGRVGGNIVNNNVISATDVGIAVSSSSKVDPVVGMIINDGLINVAGVVSKASFAAGVLQFAGGNPVELLESTENGRLL